MLSSPSRHRAPPGNCTRCSVSLYHGSGRIRRRTQDTLPASPTSIHRVLGQPIHWAGGQLNYYVDQGPLSNTVTNRQAVAMVDAAAALWSAVPTAGVTLTDKGPLNEDVSGANIVASGTNFTVTNEQIDQLNQIAQPADVTPSATQYPVGVIFDEDGSVINALFGPGASDPTSCEFNGVWFWIDNVNPDADHRPRHPSAQRPLRDQCKHAGDDELRTGARLRPHSQPGLRAGEPRCAPERRARRHAGLAGDAAHQRSLRLDRRPLHSRASRYFIPTILPPSTASTPSPPKISPAFPASSSPRQIPSPFRAPLHSRPAWACRA